MRNGVQMTSLVDYFSPLKYIIYLFEADYCVTFKRIKSNIVVVGTAWRIKLIGDFLQNNQGDNFSNWKSFSFP